MPRPRCADERSRGYPDQVPLRLDLAEPRVDLAPLVAALAEGACAVIPTDTVYGLVCDAGAAGGVRAAERAQGARSAPALDRHVRDASRPPRQLLAPLEAAARGARTGAARRAGRPCSCPTRSAATRTSAATIRERIGVRVSAFPPALARAIDGVGAILATSANLHGGADPRTLGEVPAELAAAVRRARRRRAGAAGRASTVLDLSAARPVILREGALATADALALIA